MKKKTLKEYCNEIDICNEWLLSYKKYVPIFIEEAKTKNRWQDWNPAIFYEFFERSSGQCVSSLRQGYFTKDEQTNIKSNWSEIAPFLKVLAENQVQPHWNAYREIKSRIRKYTAQDRRAATNRLVASLQPNLIGTIVNEHHLKDLISKINAYSTSNVSMEGDWFNWSHNICKLFQQELEPENPIDIITYPWQLMEHFNKNNPSQFKKQEGMQNIIRLIQTNKNLILTGAPGTGKTYKTAEIAVALIDGTNKLPSNRLDLMNRYKTLLNAKQIVFTTFHQSLDYEEFIEGLKPELEDHTKEMTYQIKNGIFKDICERANEKTSMTSLNEAIEQFKESCLDSIIKVKNKSGTEFSVTYRGGKTFRVRSVNSEAVEGKDFPANIDAIKRMYQGVDDKIYNKTYVWGILNYIRSYYKVADYHVDNSDKKYVLIIDEINRGNISKIFGELITLLEKDKRIGEENELTVTLPYSQETFGIPTNLYIVGTMNTADRSIGHIDYAIRRRFTFFSFKSDKNIITSYDKYDKGIKEKAEKIYDEVKDLISSNINLDLDPEDLMIGHSYFLCKTADDLRMRIEFEMIPLLEEYEKDGIIMIDKTTMKTKFEEWKALLS